MARGFSNALRLALSGATGGLEGYGAQQDRARQIANELAAKKRQEMLDTLAVVGAGGETLPERQQTGLRGAGSAIGSALSLASGGPAMPFAPTDLTKLKPPAGSVTVGGTAFAIPSLQEREDQALARELSKLKTQQEYLDQRQGAKETRENRGYFDVLQKAGEIPKDATFEMYQNTPLKPTFDEYLKRTSLEQAMQRTNVMANAQSSRGGYVQGVVPGTETPQLIFAPSGGGSLRPTGVQVPPKQGEGTGSSKERRDMAEITATLRNLDEAEKAAAGNPNAFGMKTLAPNMALGRLPGVKERATVFKAMTQLRRTDFGTAMSRQEKETGQPVFVTGGDDANTVIDKIRALKESSLIRLNAVREASGMPPLTLEQVIDVQKTLRSTEQTTGGTTRPPLDAFKR